MESSARLCEWRDEFQRISEQMYSGSAATEAISECVKSCGHFCAQLLREIQFARSRIIRVASKWMQQRGDGNEASRIDHDGCYSLTLRECHKLICKFSPEFERLFDDDLQLRGPTLSEFEIIKPISCGAFGRVFVARKKSTGDLFALKVVRKSDLDSDGIRASLMLERDLLSHSLKRGSVRLFSSFRTRTKLVLVMEFVPGGDVYSLLCNLGFLDEAVTKQYIAELVVALDSMHKIGIVHLDVKPDNMLVDKDGHVVLTDFGLSRCIRRSKLNIDLTASDSLLEMSSTGTFLVHQFLVQTQGIRTAKEVVGTPDYLAPEVLRGEGPAFAADFWSVGVIVFEFVMGLPPFHDASMDMIFDNVVNCRYEQPVVPDEMSADVNDLMHCLLDPNPETRLGARGAEEIMQHPFFADIDWNLLRSMQPKFIPELQSEDDTSYFQSRKPVANLTAEIDGDDNTSSGHASRSPALHQEHGSSATAREAVTAAAALSPTGRMENSESGGRVAKGPSGHIVKPHLNLFDSVRIPVLECAERKSTSPAANRPTSRGRARAGGNQSSGDRNSPNTPGMSRGRPSSKQTQPRRLQLIDGDELNKVSDFAEFSHICVANLAARNLEVLRASQPPQSSTDTMVGLW
ncbi:putative serine/threonine protein kinase IREH1 [Porphyridium purpureum]|uniref:non-specific serine/threonine protein kinase n=1 Tax=Porphyridium purpureum TaxID=35688 RepID=A0A5J4YI17_PORPP|nr:putative serine/threonine protein kinase IREH1 [Porphyridium purpureum]|eukprot:POR2163..scf297_16